MSNSSHDKKKVLECPRCKSEMREAWYKNAFIDNCNKCKGTFFDQGEMFAVLGATADPSYWDRPETGGRVRPGKILCPRCSAEMLLQDVAKDDLKVEIDRCPNCGGIWLDSGESEKIMSIGARMIDVVNAERRAALADLAKMGDVSFSPPGLIYRFLSLFKKK